jgi:outer membrane protein TolC
MSEIIKYLISLPLGIATVAVLTACERTSEKNSAADALSNTYLMSKVPADIDLSSGKLSLKDFVRLLSVSDESIRAQDVEIALAEQEALGTWGTFEPQAYTSFDRSSELSQTSAAEYRSRGTALDSSGTPSPYSADASKARVGVESKSFDGVKMDLFYEMDRTRNSLQVPAARPSPEYSAAMGFSVIIPVLRNAESDFNRAPIEIANIEQEIAKETSRLVKSQRVFDAIKTYLLVQRAQSRVYWRQKSLATAKALETEMLAQFNAGLRSSAELTEASAKVSEQQSLLTEARQNLNEQIGAFQIFFLAIERDMQPNLWTPSDTLRAPPMQFASPARLISPDEAMQERSETRINALRIELEEMRVLMAENQAKPELNIKLDVQRNFLADQYVSFRSLYGQNNPYRSWRVGFEFRRGLLGDITKKKQLEAAKLRETQAELTMNAFRQRIASEMNGIKGILERANDQTRQQTEMVDAYLNLFKTEKQRAKSGQSSLVEVLNRELAYYIAKEGQQDAIAQQNLSSYLASQISGTLLSRMEIE